MTDVIAAIVIAVLFTGACLYIYKEKKKGSHCIGCPMAKECAKAKACQACRTKKLSGQQNGVQ